jgi:diguanylate cyclase (GGDEF)-like protein
MTRYGLRFGLLIIDVDHFKQFNDQYGHDTGDLVLQSVANTLLCCIRPFDAICRWGGEEFSGIFPNIDLTTLEEIAERLKMLVQHSEVQTDDGLLSVTVSIGGTMAKDNDTTASLVKRADALMYVSKKEGRNRVTVDKPINR